MSKIISCVHLSYNLFSSCVLSRSVGKTFLDMYISLSNKDESCGTTVSKTAITLQFSNWILLGHSHVDYQSARASLCIILFDFVKWYLNSSPVPDQREFD